MNPLHCFAPRNAVRRLVTSGLLLAVVGGLCFAATGCSSNDLATVVKATTVAYQDATSPAGQKLLADVASSALNLGLDIASGNDVGAAVAGIQGAASAMRDYEGLPTAPSSTTIAKVAAAGSGVGDVAVALAPGVESIVQNALKSASTQKISVTADDIIEALARGFDSVASVKGA